LVSSYYILFIQSSFFCFVTYSDIETKASDGPRYAGVSSTCTVWQQHCSGRSDLSVDQSWKSSCTDKAVHHLGKHVSDTVQETMICSSVNGDYGDLLILRTVTVAR